MTLRTVLIVVLAVVFGVAAAVYATNAVHQNREVVNPERVDVVVTVKPVARGVSLTSDMLAVKQITKEDAPADALHGLDEAVGRVVETGLVKDVYVLESMLAKKGTSSGMAPLIREGMQAATILTPTASAGVGGFIQPGDKVDVFLTVDHFNPDDRGGTVRLMQVVEVLAVDNRLELGSAAEGKLLYQRDLRFVTLLVAPKQAQVLADAQRRGTLTLILRSPQDTQEVRTELVTPEDLKFPPRPPEEKKPEVVPVATNVEPPPPPAPPPPIRVIMGSNLKEEHPPRP
jgi:pilus assembly protein CpaB